MDKDDLLLVVVILFLLLHNTCSAQSMYSIQETNRQLHQAEMDRQQRLILQQQYIQSQQLDQIRRDAEFRFNHNQSNRTHDIHNHNNPIRY